MNVQNLVAHTIPLQGKHLIEASAGTGKTYNITRIYLRLLLEQELTVEQILLMTFTKDATQELRARIDSFIRDALNNWSKLCEEDPYFQAINERVAPEKVTFLLKRSLLFLDEAAIFTIHGFCQRVLNQHAFTSGLPFNATMAADSSDLRLQACQDWYRQLAKGAIEDFALVAAFWPTPSSFLLSFNKAISHTAAISLIKADDIEVAFTHLLRQAHRSLERYDSLFNDSLILPKKTLEQAKRREELLLLKHWLAQLIVFAEQGNLVSKLTKMPDAFFDGRRYSRSKFKTELVEAFSLVNEVKLQAKNIVNKISKANAYAVVRQGIYHIRKTVLASKKQFNLLDFDDLINTLADCLARDSAQDNQLASNLLAQYPVALIDEFQDTDPKQFAILQAIYYCQEASNANAGLYLIGDPKQAIYGFRGGDIFAYLNARSGCDFHWLMDTNWRSTPQMVSAYNHVFTLKSNVRTDTSPQEQQANYRASVFGYDIPYIAVKAGKKFKKTQGKQVLPDDNKALQLIHFTSQDKKVNQGVRVQMAHWCASEISQLLQKNIAKPQDIAILVRDGAEASNIKQALQCAHLDSVFLSDRTNLFHSVQAKQVLALLSGILQLENERIFIAGICSGLLGIEAKSLFQLQQDELAYQALKFAFIDYRQQWQRQGFIAMAVNLMHQHFVICELDKDRILTNLLHLFEIIQSASQRFHQPQELLFWFEQQVRLENPEAEAELRLESDENLLRIVTQHGSKGLEYPIVFIPYASRHKDPLKFGLKSVSYLEYHDEQGQLVLSLDGHSQAKKAMSDEAYAETVRLLYVAITRAEQRCYLLTCPFEKYHLSPLGQTLQWQEDHNIASSLQALQSHSPTEIAFREVDIDNEQLCASGPSAIANEFKSRVNTQVSKFTGKIERDWWLSSFSALSRNMRHTGISMPDRDTEVIDNTRAISLDEQVLRFKLEKGAHSGNLLHDILEKVDFSQANWPEAIKWPLLKYGQLTSGFCQQDLVDWLDDTVNSPFIKRVEGIDEQMHQGSICAGRLVDVPLEKTLRECEFYFPMKAASISTLSGLLTEHRHNATDISGSKLVRNISPVQLPNYKKLTGMMHGFIDLIFQYQGKYYLCDYKSSHLGDNFTDYNHQSLLANIEKNHYDLQYLIYSLALHRYLKCSLVDYDVATHFGGVYYLYLRGMTSKPEYTGAGVYYRAITRAELTALDHVFLGENIDETGVYDQGVL